MRFVPERPEWLVYTVRPADLSCALRVRDALGLSPTPGAWRSPVPGGGPPAWRADDRDVLARGWSEWWDELIDRRVALEAVDADEGAWPAALPPATALHAVVQEHEDELRSWVDEHERQVFEAAASNARDDYELTGSLALAVRRHRPNEPTEFAMHVVEGPAGDVGFVVPNRRCCVIWGDVRQSQAAFDGLVKGLTA